MGLGAGVLAAAVLAAGPHGDGVNITAYARDGYRAPAVAEALERVDDLGLERVAVVTTWYVDDLADSTVAPDPERTPSDASVLATIRAARDRGLSVLLKPHVDVRDGSFRGDLHPSDRAAWWVSYGAMVDHYAELAEHGGADALTVGVELRSLSSDTAAFEHLVARARERFGGTLTYAANWDEATAVGFWPSLDVIGVDAYYPLADAPGASADALEAAWRPHVDELRRLSERTGRPVLLTELGYAARPQAAVDPARAGAGDGPLDVEAQERAYEAAIAAWDDVPWLDGILWWDWPIDARDAEGAAYTPRGRPAERLLGAEPSAGAPKVLAMLDAVPWPLLAIVAIWAVVAAGILAVLRVAAHADRQRDREAPPPPPKTMSPPPPPQPAAPAVTTARRFARGSSADLLTDVGPPDAQRLVALTAQVLGADACELRHGDAEPPRALDDEAIATTPLLVRGRMHGELTVRRDDPDHCFTPGDLDLLGEMAELVAEALTLPTAGPWPTESVRAQLEALSMTGGRDDDERHRAALIVSLARLVAERLAPDDPRTQAEIVLAARLHDVGMLRVPRARLRRAGPLAPVDAHLVEHHPEWGSEILAGIPGMQAVAAIVLFHQERFDGAGYPHGLAGERIPLASRVVGACAAWAAIVAGGPHAAPRSPEHAVEELRRHAGSQFDPVVVEAIAAASPLVPVLRVPV
ncbi:MAG TPA: HD domain-containing phosphohydrolase [Capillimicrobium sp.]|nr:HD domain-containing phosphohydrolase [Capillimicrobium sp.]